MITQPTISIIAAMDQNRVIGHNNQLPWHMPADLKFFKKHTVNKPVIMGRKTYESMGRALPNRRNLVITRNPNFQAPDCELYDNLEEALQAAPDAEEIMILGGAGLFQQAIPYCHRMYLTLIEGEFDGDTYFPEWSNQHWQCVERDHHPADQANSYPYTFTRWERK